MKAGKHLASGVAVGLLVFKPQYMLLFPLLFFLSGDKRQFIKGFLAISVVLFIISMLMTGSGFLGDYYRLLFVTDTPDFGNNPASMFTLHSLASSQEVFGGMKEYVLYFDAFAYFTLLFLVFLFLRGRRYSLEHVFASFVILSVPLSIHSHAHDLSIYVLPILILYSLYKRRGYYENVYKAVMTVLFLLPLFIFLPNRSYSSLILVIAGLLVFLLGLSKLVNTNSTSFKNSSNSSK
jgi:hypothetical protein